MLGDLGSQPKPSLNLNPKTLKPYNPKTLKPFLKKIKTLKNPKPPKPKNPKTLNPGTGCSFPLQREPLHSVHNDLGSWKVKHAILHSGLRAFPGSLWEFGFGQPARNSQPHNQQLPSRQRRAARQMLFERRSQYAGSPESGILSEKLVCVRQQHGTRMQADNLTALSKVAINSIFSCLIQKPNKPKKAKDQKLQ